jgi:hypothetical protein
VASWEISIVQLEKLGFVEMCGHFKWTSMGFSTGKAEFP